MSSISARAIFACAAASRQRRVTYRAAIVGECANLKLAGEEVGIQPDLKAIAHEDLRRCRAALCLGLWAYGGERPASSFKFIVLQQTAELVITGN